MKRKGTPLHAAHGGCVVWLTGLSGSGKTTLANSLCKILRKNNYHAHVLDADLVRKGLCKDLGYSKADRDENIRRVAEVARLFADAGVICITAFISPFRAARERARRVIGRRRFLEIHVATGLEECERRDAKGLYRRARQGKVRHFTGIGQAYEPPATPDLRIDTGSRPGGSGGPALPALAATSLMNLLRRRGFLRKGRAG